MTTSNEPISPDDFSAEYEKQSGILLYGYAYFDSLRPEFIIFGRHRGTCPTIPIPKNRIKSIHTRNQLLCLEPSGKKRRIWKVQILLIEPAKDSELYFFAKLLENYDNDDSMVDASQARCNCQRSRIHEHIACHEQKTGAQQFENPNISTDEYDDRIESLSCRRSSRCSPSTPYLYCRNGNCHCTSGCGNFCRRSSRCSPSTPYLYCRNGNCHCTSGC